MKERGMLRLCAAAAVAVVLAAGCGSSSSSSSSSSASSSATSTSGSSSGTSSAVAQAQQIATQAEQVPTAIGVTTPLGKKPASGRTIVFLRCDQPVCGGYLEGLSAGASALGWHIDDHQTFDEILARITRHGVPVIEGSVEEATLRGVERLARFPGPNRLTQEIFTRPNIDASPLDVAVRGGFVTAEAGIGHVAVTSTKPPQR